MMTLFMLLERPHPWHSFSDITAIWHIFIFSHLLFYRGGPRMHIDRKRLLENRINSKDLDHQFKREIEHGMGCSPFVSNAITKVAHDVYFPLLNSHYNLKPGQMLFQCLGTSNTAKTQIAEADIKTVVLTIDAGKTDMSVRTQKGVVGLRQFRICRLCHEAYNQGAVLTVEDLAYRIMNVGERTIIRDLAHIRKDGQNPPLRSTVKDIGRTISHKSLIVKNWLLGDERSDLNRKYHHSISSIENYIDTFKRVVALHLQKYPLSKIVYLQKCSQKLIEGYLDIWYTYRHQALPFRIEEIEQLLQNAASEQHSKKKTRRVL